MKKLTVATLVCSIMLLWAASAHAQGMGGEAGALTRITDVFRDASVNWNNVLMPYALSICRSLVLLAWVLLALAIVLHYDTLVSQLVYGLLGFGAAIFFVMHGSDFVASWFEGVKRLGYIMTGIQPNPSSIIDYGTTVATPIFKSLGDQGFFSWARAPLTTLYSFAGAAIQFAYIVLAFVYVSELLMSYILIASASVWLAFMPLSFTRPLAMIFVKLTFGTLASLLVTVLLIAISGEVGAILEQELRAHFEHVGVTFTMVDYSVPLGVGLIMAFMWAFIPYRFAVAAGSFVPTWQLGSLVAMGEAGQAAAGTVGAATKTATSTSQSSTGGGGRGAIGAPQERSGSWGKQADAAKVGWQG